MHPRERDQRQVHRVQLQLDRHEDQQRVASDQHADGAEREQHAGQHQEVRDRRPHDGLRLGPAMRLELRPGSPARAFRCAEHHRRDRRHDQQDRRDLEREEVVPEQHLGERLRVAALRSRRRTRRAPSSRTRSPRGPRATISTTNASAEHERERPLQRPAARGTSSPRSTPSSMITNRNSTMIAPAYTMICTANRNGASSIRIDDRETEEVHDEEQRRVDGVAHQQHRRPPTPPRSGRRPRTRRCRAAPYRPSSAPGVGPERRRRLQQLLLRRGSRPRAT